MALADENLKHVKKGDTGSPLRCHLRRLNEDGTYSDAVLTGATLTFSMRKRGKTTRTVDAQGMTVESATGGLAYYTFVAGDVDETGTFDGEIVVTYSDTTTETFPEEGFITVVVEGEI